MAESPFVLIGHRRDDTPYAAGGADRGDCAGKRGPVDRDEDRPGGAEHRAGGRDRPLPPGFSSSTPMDRMLSLICSPILVARVRIGRR